MTNLTNITIDLGLNGKGSETFNDLKTTDTLGHLKKKLEGRISKNNVTGIKLIYLGKVLSGDNKTLAQFGIESRAVLSATIKLRGGTEGDGEISDNLANKLGITLTTKKCSICWTDEGHKRIAFSECGGKCQFCRCCIKDQYKKCLFTNNQSQVVCPVGSECNNAKWQTRILLQILNLSDEEIKKCYRQLNSNYISRDPNMTSCPGCEFTVNKEGINHNRVRCPVPKCPLKKDWCFKCAGEWKGTTSNYKICGNNNCSGSKIAQKTSQLLMSDKATVSNSKNDINGVPISRFCVGCTVVIEWDKKCKHMTCICGHQFCIICVKKWKGCNCGKETCKNDNNVCSHGNYCSITPIENQIQKLKLYIH